MPKAPIIIAILLLAFPISIECRGELPLSSESFFEQYISALKNGDIETRERLVSDHPDEARTLAESLLSQGSDAIERENPDIALSMFHSSLEIYQQLKDRSMESTLMVIIARLYERPGNYETSLQYLQEALKITMEIGKEKQIGSILNNMGDIYRYYKENESALGFYHDALKIRSRVKDTTGEIVTLSNIGDIYHDTGYYSEALSYYERALKSAKGNMDKVSEAALLNNISEVYLNRGNYGKALKFYLSSLKIVREMDYKEGLSSIFNNLGLIYSEIGDYQRSLKYYQDALKIATDIGDKSGESTTLNNMGIIYYERKDYQKSLNFFRNSLRIKRDIHDRAGEAIALSNIGMIYSDKKEYSKAVTYYKKTLHIKKEISDRAGEGITLNNIGTLYFNTMKYENALKNYQTALKISSKIGNREGARIVMENMGYLYESQGMLRESLSWYKQSIDRLEETRNTSGGIREKENFLAQNINVYHHTIRILHKLGYPEEAFTYAERGKARAFLEQLYESSIGIKKGMNRRLINEENSIQGRLFAIGEYLQMDLQEEKQTRLLKEQRELEDKLSEIRLEIRSTNPLYANLRYPEPFTIKEVQSDILRLGEVIVEFVVGVEEVYVFIIGKGKFFIQILKITEQELNAKVKDILTPFRHLTFDKFDYDISFDLYKILLKPIEEKIVKSNEGREIDTLIIIPDGILYYLPFGLMKSGIGKRSGFLVDKYAIVYSPSVSLLRPDILHHKTSKEYRNNIIAFAPFSSKKMDKGFRPNNEEHLLSETIRNRIKAGFHLPNSSDEVKSVCRLFDNSTYNSDREATKDYFKSHSISSRYLHFSTHAYLNPDTPMYSGLLLNDGILQTYEIFNMDINTDLVTLSACKTGLGELKRGEGLIGLTRAFMYAGSPSILVTLWRVEDISTTKFMKRFYRNLKNGMNKAKALQETKKWMIRKSYQKDDYGNITTYNHPFYWAPFILVGEFK